MRRTFTVLIAVVFMSAVPAGQGSRAASVTLKAAIAAEEIERDVPKAIDLYERAVKEAGSDRALAPQILLRLAQAQAKAGRADDAKASDERLVREYPGTAQAKTAQQRLRERSADRSAVTFEVALPRAGGLAAAAPDTRLGMNWITSPDGKWAAQSGPQGLILHELTSGMPQRLVSGPGLRPISAVVWSPDSRELGFAPPVIGPGGRVPPWEFQAFDVRTGDTRAIGAIGNSAPSAVVGTLRAWTANDEIVMTSPQREVIFVPTHGGDVRRATIPVGFDFGDISMDGMRVILTGPEQLLSWSPATGDRQPLTHGFEVSLPRVSLDGQLVAFLSKQSGAWSLRVAPLTGSEIFESIVATELPSPSDSQSRFLRWTAGGRLTFDARITTQNLHRLDLAGSGASSARLQQLVHDGWIATDPVISPDGRRIAYVGQDGISMMNSDGSNERPLGLTGLPLGWSSTGELIVDKFDGTGPVALDARTAAARSTGHSIRLSAADYGPGLRNAQFLSSSNSLILREGGRFSRRQADGRETSIADLRAAQTPPSQLEYWAVSPAGDRLAYVTGPRAVPGGQLQLHVRTIGRGDDQIAAEIMGPWSVRWSADGRSLIYATGRQNAPEFRRFDVETRESAIVLEPKHTTGVFPAESTWSVAPCVAAPDMTFLVCQVQMTNVYRFAWDNVTDEAVSKLLKRR